MLLPSALSCESRQYSSRSGFAASRFFSPTPPPSDDVLIAGNGLLGTCRALQSLLNVSPAPSPHRAAKPQQQQRLQSPFQARSPSHPHQNIRTSTRAAPKKVVKHTGMRPRGVNKRRRDVFDDPIDSVSLAATTTATTTPINDSTTTPLLDSSYDMYSTPKRQRLAPPDLPLGLHTADFRSLEQESSHLESPESQSSPGRTRWNLRSSTATPSKSLSFSSSSSTSTITAASSRTIRCKTHNTRSTKNKQGPTLSPSSLSDSSSPLVSLSSAKLHHPSSDWTSEDDGRLVELVLDKLKLSKRDWTECARRMGKDHDSVGKRWRALVGEGNVGLRRGRRMVRGRIDETWRNP
ncbi:hypothetical protein FQN57_005246 [Myotisia sp. PD_48]|nr:hypothetical protein FQN57_005246 [Myotisia sp. PD_48]